MRAIRFIAAAIIAIATAGPHARAASPRDTVLVTPAWLAQHLADPDLVLLHVSDKPSYDKEHIPGARFVNWSQDLATPPPTDPNSLSLEMLDSATLHDRLASFGISDRSRIVVYFGNSWVTPSARVLFTLDYAGLGGQTSLMDGGTGAWVRDGHRLTDAVPAPPKPGALSPLKLKPIVVDAAFVNAHRQSPGFSIVDAREAAAYDGVGPRSSRATGPPARPGHVAGAHSLPWNNVIDDTGALRSAQELETLFTKAGVKPGDTVVGYCYVGQIATEMLLAARTLGHPVLLYDGLYEDWNRHVEYRVDNPSAAGLRDSMLVTPAWLAQHLSDPDLVVLHVSDAASYAKRHIPGARLIQPDDISVSDHRPGSTGLMTEMPPLEVLHDKLAAFGIGDHSRVVVYFDGRALQAAARVVFTLDYAGLGKATSLLDGALDGWVREGHSVTTVAPPAAVPATLAPLRMNNIVVDGAFVKANLKTPNLVVIDARAASYYDGVETGTTMAGVSRPGHIAGARNIPFTEIVDAQNKLKSPAELTALFEKAGVKPGETVVGYCHIGLQATAMLFAAKSLGHPVLLYDGSFEDWAGHPEYPVENPGRKGGLRP